MLNKFQRNLRNLKQKENLRRNLLLIKLHQINQQQRINQLQRFNQQQRINQLQRFNQQQRINQSLDVVEESPLDVVEESPLDVVEESPLDVVEESPLDVVEKLNIQEIQIKKNNLRIVGKIVECGKILKIR